MSVKINMIVAVSQNMGIGINGTLPWKLKEEMAFFTRMTKLTADANKKNAVIMGRKTWESIPIKHRPLPGRVNIILSRSILNVEQDAIVCNSLRSVIEKLNQAPLKDMVEMAWIIGGSSLYKEAMESPLSHRIYITRVLHDFHCDTFLPEISSAFKLIRDANVPEGRQEENGIKYKYEVYERNVK